MCNLAGNVQEAAEGGSEMPGTTCPAAAMGRSWPGSRSAAATVATLPSVAATRHARTIASSGHGIATRAAGAAPASRRTCRVSLRPAQCSHLDAASRGSYDQGWSAVPMTGEEPRSAVDAGNAARTIGAEGARS
jgi:hypothetical protein